MGLSASKSSAAPPPITQQKPVVTSKDVAILSMKTQRDKLKIYKKQLESVQNIERAKLRACMANGQRREAMAWLKKQKYQDLLIQNCENQLFTLEQLTSQIEFKLIEQQVMQGLTQGTQVLKQLNSQLDIRQVENILMDSSEAIQEQQLISEQLRDAMGVADAEAVDHEIELELDKLLLADEQTIQLPDVPTHEPASAAVEKPVKEAIRKEEALLA